MVRCERAAECTVHRWSIHQEWHNEEPCHCIDIADGAHGGNSSVRAAAVVPDAIIWTLPIEPRAVEVIKSACAALEAAKAMSFTAVSTYEKAARNGQPLYYAVQNHITMQRPDKLRVITPGDGVPDE